MEWFRTEGCRFRLTNCNGMKKNVSFLLAALTVALVSCGDKKTESDPRWFERPEVAVNGTTAAVSCRTAFGEGVPGSVAAGFAYAPTGGDFAEAAGTVDGNRLTCTLSGLQPETSYQVYAYADLPTGRVRSESVAFKTGKDDVPDPGEPVFGTPSASDVTATTATLNGSVTFDSDGSDYTVYFIYKYANSATSGFSRVNVSSGSGTKTASVTDLASGTEYEFQLCAERDGRIYSSTVAVLVTQNSVNPGHTRHSGWAELPAEEEGDYYYAYHMRADAKSVRNFSVCYSAKMRSGLWSAFPLHASYQGTQKRTDAWAYDPVVPRSLQPDLIEGSYQPQPGYSKGHLLASNDRTVSYETNAQTFYVTNVAPQWQNSFNSGVWSSLEEDCWKNVCADTLYVVSGVHYADTGKTLTDQSGKPVAVPTHFYRVLMRSKSGSTGKPLWQLAADEIECVGFWFENRAYPSGKPAQYMTSVAEIEREVGFGFFPNVPQAPKEGFDKSAWNFR